MPSNFTENYNLSQWERTDQVRMEDFNADNAKVDTAIKSEADARASAVAALSSQVAGKGNCRIWSTTYTGTGASSKSISFPGTPLIAFVSGLRSGRCFPLVYGAQQAWTYAGGSGCYCDLSWGGSYVSLSGGGTGFISMNESGETYRVIALIAMD